MVTSPPKTDRAGVARSCPAGAPARWPVAVVPGRRLGSERLVAECSRSLWLPGAGQGVRNPRALVDEAADDAARPRLDEPFAESPTGRVVLEPRADRLPRRLAIRAGPHRRRHVGVGDEGEVAEAELDEAASQRDPHRPAVAPRRDRRRRSGATPRGWPDHPPGWRRPPTPRSARRPSSRGRAASPPGREAVHPRSAPHPSPRWRAAPDPARRARARARSRRRSPSRGLHRSRPRPCRRSGRRRGSSQRRRARR